MLEGTSPASCRPSAQDEARFQTLGFPAARMRVVGNIKLDVDIPRLTSPERVALARELGLPAGFVVLGSSTWPGEEAALLEALQHARAGGLQATLLLVPRHAERRPEIEQVLGRSGLRFHFRTDGAAPGEVDVAVADTTGGDSGSSPSWPKRSRLSWARAWRPTTEGQTPVEAAALGKPILFGPGMGNFRQLAQELIDRGAAHRVENGAALAGEVAALMRDHLAN